MTGEAPTLNGGGREEVRRVNVATKSLFFITSCLRTYLVNV